MQLPRILVLTLISLSTLASAHADTYCRFEHEETIAYGRVIDDKIHVLSAAPWTGGSLTGAIYEFDQIHLLAPSEPALIAGLVKSYRSAWPDGGEPPAVRWFIKPPGAAAPPDVPLLLPGYLDEVKVEVELVIVIGRTVKDASPEEARSAIFGYTLGNDIVGQIKSFQRLSGDSIDRKESVLGVGLKIGDGFAPFGPFIQTGIDWNHRTRTLEVTSADPGRRIRDETTTSALIYDPGKIISDLSKVLTLRPGDIVFSGTNRSYPVRAGDSIRISIDGIGEMVTTIE